jgi:hypothetical protein
VASGLAMPASIPRRRAAGKSERFAARARLGLRLLLARHADGLGKRSSEWANTGECNSVTMTNAAVGAGIADNLDTPVVGSSAQLAP